MVRVIFSNGNYICRCSFENRHLPKDSGFRWNETQKFWYTNNHGAAARLYPYCEGSAKTEIDKARINIDTWTTPLAVPSTENLKPFQESAALFALNRNRSYLALDPGLGKTPIAAVVAATLHKKRPHAFVYICPPFMARNTEAEFTKWAPELKAEMLHPATSQADVLIVSDSKVHRDKYFKDILLFISHHKHQMREVVLFVDEAHRFKNDTAVRTRALFGDKTQSGVASSFDRIVYLSGTPMPNRPIELFSILNHSAPDAIDHMNKFEFGRKFCAGHKNAFGWDFTGASNVNQLVLQVTDKFMLRMKKEDVLKELPPKTEEMVLIGENLPPKLADLDAAILREYSPVDLMEGRLSLKVGADKLHLSTYRKELGFAKVKEALAVIKYYLTETPENLLVFAIHKEVIKSLRENLLEFEPLTITGETPMADRHKCVSIFQDPEQNRRLFIGNIQAAGVGLTLTRATRVIFVEFSWTPSDNDQASDRAHRIGQHDNVLVQYLVYKNSVDKAVIETILRKRKVTQKL